MRQWLKHIRTSSWLCWAFFFLLFGYALKFLSGKGPFAFAEFNEVALNQFVGAVFMVFSGLIWLKRSGVTQCIAILSFSFLFTDSWVAFEESGFVPEQLIEHAAKLLLPILIIAQNLSFWTREHTQFSLKVIVALTFIGHGLFAAGWHYVPGNFHAMTTSILGVTGNQSINFLHTVGTLDFIAAICLFLPKPFYKPALVYFIIWGSLTTLARTAFPISTMDMNFTSLYQGITGTIYRIPHAMLPILLFSYAYRNAMKSSTNNVATES